MKKIIMTVIIFCVSISCIFGENDPFDISSEIEKIKELGYPTKIIIENARATAYEYYEKQEWEKAAESLNHYAKLANYMANLIRSGIEPYYGASYDDRKDFPRSRINALANYETLSNKYVKERNEARVNEALCYLELGDKESALPLLVSVLDLIDIENYGLWDKARNSLYKIIELE